MSLSLLQQIASDTVLNTAFKWLWERRHNYHHNDDVWHVRFHHASVQADIQALLLAGDYWFEPVRRVAGNGGDYWIWAARDAWVLKAMALVLGDFLRPKLSPNCFHLEGRGGGKAAVRAVQAEVAYATFVFRSDVKGYYASIHHEQMMMTVCELIREKAVLRLVQGYLRLMVDEDGHLREIRLGINLGCPLSPLMGAVYLKPLDDALTSSGWFYARFMDDWVVLAPTRGKLRQAIKRANAILEALKIEKHPDKTYIGRVAHGFDFLGYQFDPNAGAGLMIADKTKHNHRKRLQELAAKGANAEEIANYKIHWGRWVRSGVELREDE